MIKIAVAFSIAIALVHPSQADDSFTRVGMFALPHDRPDTIILVEDITIAAPTDFYRALRQRPDAKTIELISGGGSVYGALPVAFEIHQRGMTTVVPEEGWCYSACAYLFFAGARRVVEGELGVHQISSDEEVTLYGAQTTIADILDALETFDVAPEIISVMLRTAPADIYVFSAQDLTRLGIERDATQVKAAATSLAAEPVETPEPPQSDEPAMEVAATPPVTPPVETGPPQMSVDLEAPPNIDVMTAIPQISPKDTGPVPLGRPENVTIVPKTTNSTDVAALGRTERMVTFVEPRSFSGYIGSMGFTSSMIEAINAALAPLNIFDMGIVPQEAQLRILYGPSRTSNQLIPYRLSIYFLEGSAMRHMATVALTDKGQYILGIEPGRPSALVENPGSEKQDRAFP